MTPTSEPSHPCPSCGNPVDGAQRYCLHCGERVAAPAVDYAVAWGAGAESAAGSGGPQDPGTPGTPTDDPDPEGAGGLRGRLDRMPRAFGPIAAAVVLLLGVAAGTLASAGTGSSAASASAAGRGVIVLGGRGAAPAPAATTPPADTPVDDTATDDTASDDLAAPDVVAPAATDPAGAAAPAADDTTDTGDDTSGDDDLGGDTSGDDGSSDEPSGDDDALTNVWVISLANRADWFGASSPAPYLSKDLAAKGAVLNAYTPVATGALPGGVALLSGQGPTDVTPQDCPTYTDVTPTTLQSGLATGQGCVYPPKALTLADQVAKAGQTYRAYVQGQGTGCRHPTLGQADPWRDPAAPDGFLTARNPFVYFHSIIDNPACSTKVADFGAFETDIAIADTVPALSWIVPDTRNDGRDPAPGADGTPGTGGGAAAADAFLRDVVPKITATDAYKDGGLIAIVPDGPAPPTLPGAPATPPTATGALLISPKVKPGATSTTATGPYALLRTIEDRLSLAHLGHAGDADTVALGDGVFTTQTSEALR